MIAPHVRLSCRQSVRTGFTLIELLVVLAIIAILTAILLPVFAVVLENSRQSTSISNMRQISTALAQFRLDNHKDPDVLFGYAVPNGSMKSGQTTAVNTSVPGLYPEYVKTYEVFTDPNNPVDDPTAQVSPMLGVNAVNSDGTTTPTTRAFYAMDAYDTNPIVTGTNAVSSTNAVRYQRFWGNCVTDNGQSPGTHVSGGATVCSSPSTLTQDNYTRQLFWKNPPADTYVDLTTYHVKGADKVLIMMEDGSVTKMSAEDFKAHWEGANFWTINP